MAERENDGFDPMALEALQTQLNELKRQVLELEARPVQAAAALEQLEDGLVEAADILAAARLAAFGHDVRDKVNRLATAAAVIRARRTRRRSEGKAA